MSRKEDGNSTKETDETDVLVENTSSFQKAINQIKKVAFIVQLFIILLQVLTNDLDFWKCNT